MFIHEIIKYKNPVLLENLCEMYNLREEDFIHSPGDKNDYYNFAKEMQTDYQGQRLNYGR